VGAGRQPVLARRRVYAREGSVVNRTVTAYWPTPHH
jgi:hypothetical protein